MAGFNDLEIVQVTLNILVIEEAAHLGTRLHHMKQTSVFDYVAEPE